MGEAACSWRGGRLVRHGGMDASMGGVVSEGVGRRLFRHFGPPVVLGMLGVLWALEGCGPPPHMYCIRRAALVPVPAPSLRPARQATGYLEADVSSETLSYARPPKKLEGRNVGLYVPREQLAGHLLVSPIRFLTFGLSFEAGFPQNAVPISRGLIQPPNSAIGGAGFHFGLDFKVNQKVTLSFACDAWPYWIRSRIAYFDMGTEGGSCDGLPDPKTWPQMAKSTRTFLTRAQLGVGIALGWSYLSVAAGVRNQPYNRDATREIQMDPGEIDPHILQVVYPYIAINWEIEATSWLGVGLTIYQPLNFDPVIYAPVIGINFRVTGPPRSFGSAPSASGHSSTQEAPRTPSLGSSGQGEPSPGAAPPPAPGRSEGGEHQAPPGMEPDSPDW